MSEVPRQRTLLWALFVGGIPLLMGGAGFYFTSGVTVRCERNASGHAACTESRRVLKAIDVPLRRFPDVLGAASEGRTASDEDGKPTMAHVPVLLTPAGKKYLAPFDAGASLGVADLVRSIDAYAKDPKAEGLSLGGQAGGLVFFFHLLSIVFIWSSVQTFSSYVKSLFGRSGG